jgi:hypothetical protein
MRPFSAVTETSSGTGGFSSRVLAAWCLPIAQAPLAFKRRLDGLGTHLAFDAPKASLAFAEVYKDGKLVEDGSKAFMSILNDFGVLTSSWP